MKAHGNSNGATANGHVRNDFINLYNEINNNMLGTNNTTNILDNNISQNNFKYYSTKDFNNEISNATTQSDLKIININVRGLNCNYENLVTYLSTIEIQFDIICLSECHIQDDINNTDLHNYYPISGYNMFYSKSCINNFICCFNC